MRGAVALHRQLCAPARRGGAPSAAERRVGALAEIGGVPTELRPGAAAGVASRLLARRRSRLARSSAGRAIGHQHQQEDAGDDERHDGHHDREQVGRQRRRAGGAAAGNGNSVSPAIAV